MYHQYMLECRGPMPVGMLNVRSAEDAPSPQIDAFPEIDADD